MEIIYYISNAMIFGLKINYEFKTGARECETRASFMPHVHCSGIAMNSGYAHKPTKSVYINLLLVPSPQTAAGM